jgi:septal ring factor EnvC (AmiA/AmiB activator)
MLACLLFAGSALAHGASQEQSEAQLAELKKNISQINSWLNKANSEKSGLVNQLKNQEKSIAKVNKDIQSSKKKVRELLSKLNELNSDLAAHKRSLKTQQSFLIQELRALYLEGKQPALKSLLDSNDPQTSSRYLRYFSYLHEARNEKIQAYEHTLEALQETENDILRQQAELKQTQAEQEKKRKNLKQQNAARKTTLAKLQATILNKAQERDRLTDDHKRLEALLREVEQAIADIEIPTETTPFSRQKGKLAWPTRGKVIERFGSRVAQSQLRSNGIRINAADGSAVQAVHYGRVVFSDWLRGFGLIIIIDHGEGYMSLYGHNKSLMRDTGDWVNAGDILAYAGSSGGETQSGLYFEIRRNGKPINPSKWLK